MRGLIPRRQSAKVKAWQARVRPGDDAMALAARFGPSAEAYHQIVAANPHKRLGEAPVGRNFRTFLSLTAGELLSVPAHWPTPPSIGVGSPSDLELTADQFLNWQGTWSWLYSTILQPAGVQASDPSDLAAVLWSWWPYLYDQIQGWPGPYDVQAFTPEVAKHLIALAQSAQKFLAIANPPVEVLSQIPWDAVPWDLVPWKAIRDAFPTGAQKSFWELMRKRSVISSPGVPISTRPELQAPSAQPTRPNVPGAALGQSELSALAEAAKGFGSGSSLGQRAGMFGSEPTQVGDITVYPGSLGTGATPEAPGAPEFESLNWRIVEDVSWWDVPWATVAWLQFTDSEFRSCVADSENKWRLREMADDCPQCWTNATSDQIKKVVCDKSEPTCPCLPLPPGPEPEKPPEITQPNWECTPFPNCLSYPGNWPADTLPPCHPFPDCIPEWVAAHGREVPSERKETKDNTVLYVVGGAVLLTVLAGAVAVVAAPPKAPPRLPPRRMQ